MTEQDCATHAGKRQDGPEHTPRLRLKRKAPISGQVDGAWWPHSDDLVADLPDLVAVLSVRLGPILRVAYNRAEWPAMPRKTAVGSQTVRLDGYDRQPAGTVGLSGARGEILLLVVPAHSDPDEAHAILMAAAAPEDATSVGDLLATKPT